MKSAPKGSSIVLMGDISAHVGNSSVTWKGMTGRNGLSKLSLDFYENNIQTHECTWHQDTLGCIWFIDFIVVSSDLSPYGHSGEERI